MKLSLIFLWRNLSGVWYVYLIKEDVQNILLLPTSPDSLAPLGNNIVDNPLIQSRPHTRLLSSHIMASKQSRFVSCLL